jgi:acylphosphatase
MSEKASARRRLHAVIHGRVQGVSFRYYTQRRARELDLTGYVRNQWRGTVEVIAEGQHRNLEQLLAFLRVGPPAAMVTKVDLKWLPFSGSFERFEVRI